MNKKLAFGVSFLVVVTALAASFTWSSQTEAFTPKDEVRSETTKSENQTCAVKDFSVATSVVEDTLNELQDSPCKSPSRLCGWHPSGVPYCKGYWGKKADCEEATKKSCMPLCGTACPAC